ncbi:hypothetical protein cypCar_00045950 [Cyprinus carpio]|nr:hypothetical protein cypCar_00045950 [Cyprinus carpio]
MRFLILFWVTLLLLNNVAFNSLSNDPCYNYQSLDRPWRATNESGTFICDEYFSMNGWYRFFYNGIDVRMPESCVGLYSCNGFYSLWLNGPHPQIEDGVVTIEHGDSEHHHREVRSLDFRDSTSMSVGPLMWSDGNKGVQVSNQVRVSRAPSLCASLIILLISIISVLIFF